METAKTLAFGSPMRIELDREDDGRWIAEVCGIPGALSYGDSIDAAIQKAEALALRVIADKLERGEIVLSWYRGFE